MTPAVVVDVGNTRIKWGRCAPEGLVETASLPHDNEHAWTLQLAMWTTAALGRWVVSGVAPRQRDRLIAWLRPRNSNVVLLESHRQLPLHLNVEQPEHVGIDRLLNAVAVNGVRAAGAWAGIIDAGTAVTVDCVDASGVFQGGAILPGVRLMARALHEHTAQLPLVEFGNATLAPAKNTEQAVRSGIFHAVLGGIESLLARYETANVGPGECFVGGGDAAVLAPHLSHPARVWPELTLEGIRRCAEALP